ncbi:MAG: hypothetical protein R2856_37630 [Caldilineaceae bacterium]
MGVHVPDGVDVDFGRVMQRSELLSASPTTTRQRASSIERELYFEKRHFTGPDTIEVAEDGEIRTLQFAKAIIAAGSKATVPPIEGLAEVGYLTNETLFQLTERPQRLANHRQRTDWIGDGPRLRAPGQRR